jgi:hypothetical protein
LKFNENQIVVGNENFPNSLSSGLKSLFGSFPFDKTTIAGNFYHAFSIDANNGFENGNREKNNNQVAKNQSP